MVKVEGEEKGCCVCVNEEGKGRETCHSCSSNSRVCLSSRSFAEKPFVKNFSISSLYMLLLVLIYAELKSWGEVERSGVMRTKQQKRARDEGEGFAVKEEKVCGQEGE